MPSVFFPLLFDYFHSHVLVLHVGKFTQTTFCLYCAPHFMVWCKYALFYKGDFAYCFCRCWPQIGVCLFVCLFFFSHQLILFKSLFVWKMLYASDNWRPRHISFPKVLHMCDSFNLSQWVPGKLQTCSCNFDL